MPTLKPLEATTARSGAQDRAIAALFESLRTLTAEPDVKRRPIGFVHPKD